MLQKLFSSAEMVVGMVSSSKPLAWMKMEPEPCLPPSMVTLVDLEPSGMEASGMMMLSGMSVVMSNSRPPLGAGESIWRVRVVRSWDLRAIELGLAERDEESILNSPMGMEPLLPWR